MNEQSVAVTFVNHLEIDIDRAPAEVWQGILDDYLHGRKFQAAGFTVEPLDRDLSAYLGGYRMSYPSYGIERTCRVSECDAEAMRLSIQAHYIKPVESQMFIHATYSTAPTLAGSRFTIDSHTDMHVAVPHASGQAEVAAAVAALKTQFDSSMTDYMMAFKATLGARSRTEP